MQYNYFLGIDVSKQKLDLCLIHDDQIVHTSVISNRKQAVKKFILSLKKMKIPLNNILWCAEHTGIYTEILLRELHYAKANVWLESAVQIILSQGVKRGKNDKIDAMRIAQYAKTFSHKAKLYKPKRGVLVKLKKLSNIRKQLQNTYVALSKSIKEAATFLDNDTVELMKTHCKETMATTKNEIIKIENKIKELIMADKKLNKQYKLATSVVGIGMHTAIALIITSNEFLDITCPKKYACYAGVAPFGQQSGKSINVRPRVSQKANKDVKKLLHMAALTVLKLPESEFAKYYKRKKEEGKNGMTIINAIRAKLIARVFACIRDNRTYQCNYTPKISAA